MIGAQAAQRPVDGGENVLFGKIVHPARHDAALGLQDIALARDTQRFHRFAEQAFARAPSIDIRMIEKIQTGIHRRRKEGADTSRIQFVQPHAPDGDSRQTEAADFDTALCFSSRSVLSSIIHNFRENGNIFRQIQKNLFIFCLYPPLGKSCLCT